jgi:putative membrane protein
MQNDNLTGIIGFLAYFATGAGLLLLFSLVYTVITPPRELVLIRKGNVAAAVGFGGAVLGYTVPLASAIAHSVSLADMAVWGAVGLVVQLLVLGVVRLVVPAIFNDIHHGKAAPAVLLATISLAAGIVNAAAMTY